MTIGIDGNEANVSERVGVSMYTLNLLKEFHKNASKQTRFVIYLRKPPLSDLPEQNEYFKYVVIPDSVAWSQIFFPAYLATHKKPDVLFCPAHYIPRFSSVKTVVAIHDVAYFYFPEEFLKKDLYKLKNWTSYALSRSRKVISVSENTKKDIIKFYKTSEEKIEVIHNGFNQASSTEIPKEYEIPSSPYLLYVGTLQPRKNVAKLIEAFSILKKEHADLKLYIVGKKGWLYDEIFARVTQLQLQDDVIFSGYVTNAEKNALYKHAQAYVLPSLYEGFGNPPLEAMSAGCPVIVSNNSSLPEICSDACVYFDPNDTMDMVKKIGEVLSNKELRTSLKAKGEQRVKEFSWEKCASKTLEVLKKVANDNSDNLPG